MFNWPHAYGELRIRHSRISPSFILTSSFSVTNIVRASTSPSPSTYPASPSSTQSPVSAASHSFARDSSNHHHRQPLDESCTRTVMIVVNRMLALPSSSSTITTATATPGETPQTKTKACFILRTSSLSSLYDEFNLGGFQQIILSTMIRLFVLLLSTGDV